jgi:hypothetical protein
MPAACMFKEERKKGKRKVFFSLFFLLFFLSLLKLYSTTSARYEAVFAAMLPEDEIETIGNQAVRAALHLECAHCCMYHHKVKEKKR